MPSYSSTQSGNWNDPATWGGSGWPNAAGDTATINNGHTVTYNVSSTVALGQITVANGGVLTFRTDMNTKLTLGHQDLLIQNGGALNIGTAGSPIGAGYLAEVYFATTADVAKGLNIQNGGICNIYGSDVVGGTVCSYLYENVNLSGAGNFDIKVIGNLSNKWAAGQVLLLHKGTTYATNGYLNDFAWATINSVGTYNSTYNYTTLNINIASGMMPSPGTFTAGGYVLNCTRNVIIGKNGAASGPGQVNSNRPQITVSSSTNINRAAFVGCAYLWNNSVGKASFNDIVWRNGGVIGGGGSPSRYLDINNAILFSFGGIQSLGESRFTGGYLCGNSGGSLSAYDIEMTGYHIYGNAGNRAPNYTCTIKDGYIFSNQALFYFASWAQNFPLLGRIENCRIDYDVNNKNQASTYHTWPANGTFIGYLSNCYGFNPANWQNRTAGFPAFVFIEHHNQTPHDHRVTCSYGDIVRVAADGGGSRPNQRSGGSDYVMEVTTQSCLAAPRGWPLLQQRVWVESGATRTIRYYCQTTFTGLNGNSIRLRARYLDGNNGGSKREVISTQGISARTGQSDWSQYLEVSFTPGVSGVVELTIDLMLHETGKYLWVDPLPTVS